MTAARFVANLRVNKIKTNCAEDGVWGGSAPTKEEKAALLTAGKFEQITLSKSTGQTPNKEDSKHLVCQKKTTKTLMIALIF